MNVTCGGCFCGPGEDCGDCKCHKKAKAPKRAEPKWREDILPKLSAAKRKTKHFAFCSKCVKGYENDVDTSHPKCPDCGAQMANMAKEAILNEIKRRKA